MKNKLLYLLFFIILIIVLKFAPDSWKKRTLLLLSPAQAEKAEIIDRCEEINDTLDTYIDEFESVTYPDLPEVNQ